MASSKLLPIAFVVLFFMLGIIWWPSFSNLGDLFGYAENAHFKGVTLLHLFKAEVVVLMVVWAYLLSYNKRNSVTDGSRYVRQHMVLMLFIIGQVFMGFFAGGFLVHQDASWYQVIREGHEVMPSQAVILLVCYPLYLFFGGSAYLYARTRMPAFIKHKEIAFMVLTFAPLAFLPHYDSSLMDIKRDFAQLTYMGAYWILSVCWVGLGVIYVVIHSAKEILRGLSNPYSEM